ncbi:RimJ/RimL family protein N-acetyltransferase [Metabacillus crassostreae]|uniref:GNAT family N-acetyltransferase n=1 Tax=Metabacillus crassostreae TaxID=929098 RepID=UPI00195DB8F7|nr:GNAT family protein [Metabacillus crassostreae]MBM7604526.1 RimJ/RimL family protein N-acetyltransferase [Metabacillus crassostreae]
MIELRYFDRSHMDQLINWVKTPEFLIQWGGPAFHFPLDLKQLEDYMENSNTDNSDCLIYCVILKDTGNVIGHISLSTIDRENNSARIGKVLVGDESVRGKGIGYLMIVELLKIAFNDLHLHRVSLGVFDFNASAIACYEKAGFKKEGLLRDCRKVGQGYWSLWEMSILKPEWLEQDDRDKTI